MSDGGYRAGCYTSEMIQQAIRLWTSSVISIQDVRHMVLHREEPLLRYRMPASMFIYTSGGAVDVRLNGTSYQPERFGLFHGGKSTELDLRPIEACVDCYMLLYKADLPLDKRQRGRYEDGWSPFVQVYGLAPRSPLFFLSTMQRMHRHWTRGSELSRLHAKSALYRMITDLHEELEQGGVRWMTPDYVEWIKRYLQEHYAEPISLQQLAEQLPISRSLLGKQFKMRERKSPQEYLNALRLTAAMRLLRETGATVQEIALGSGYADELNLIRMFKKQMRMTPSDYRKKMIAGFTKNDIDNYSHRLYDGKELAGPVPSFNDKGEFAMQGRSKSSRTTIAALALSIMMLLSACGATTTDSGTNSSANAAPVQSQNAAEANGKETGQMAASRTVQTVMGDVEVPADPQRVIVNWYTGDVLSLDLNVVGYNGWAQETMPFYDQMMASQRIENWEPEDVMALDPDLIITYAPDDFDAFKSIAPVIVVTNELSSLERMKFLGEATGRGAQYEQALAAFESKLAEAKTKFNEEAFKGKTFSIVEDWGPSGDWSGIGYETGSRGGTLLYQHLGLTIPPKLTALIEETGKGRGTISYEVAHEYFGDYIIWFSKVGEASEYQKTEVWQSIPAVQNNRVVEIPGEYLGLFYYDDVVSLTAQLDYMVEAINALDQ
ncbi:AraC family transcriptional regulator [Paenibacillus sp. IB182496]|uniref:AraC family transcriptional regulator n=1 Tax=Paenibacillus sabuli TaxID=2772509 RepID=A0A927GSH6_9BACL|nr:AraC family transcriptional regulator [Paenibacillus sabuli]MBD2846573.1 AraC family transcriptional regulator [Paenibacillus sabuli]